MANPLQNRRQLDRADLEHMALPKPLWDATIEGVPVSCREQIRAAASRIKLLKQKGFGVFICGALGAGKSCVASLFVREARSWGYTTYCTTPTLLRDSVKAYEMFDAEMSVYDRAKTVDFLMLDDMQTTLGKDKFFGLLEVRSLLLSRHDRGLVTIITSSTTPGGWRGDSLMDMADVILKVSTAISVEGPNRHQDKQSDRKAIFDVIKDSEKTSK